MLAALAERIDRLSRDAPRLVALDGVDGADNLAVFVRAAFGTTFARMAERDGRSPDPRHPDNARHLGGQQLHLRACRPEAHADRAAAWIVGSLGC